MQELKSTAEKIRNDPKELESTLKKLNSSRYREIIMVDRSNEKVMHEVANTDESLILKL